MEGHLISLEVPRHHVKAVKTALESKNQRNRDFKIQSKDEQSNNVEIFVIQTLISARKGRVSDSEKLELFIDLGLSSLVDEIEVSTYSTVNNGNVSKPKQGLDVLSEAIRNHLTSLDQQVFTGADYTIDDLITKLPHHYSIYGQLLILPANIFSITEWSDFITNRLKKNQYDGMFAAVAQAFHVTNIAIQSFIPGGLDFKVGNDSMNTTANIQRRPDIIPVFGEFGTFVQGEPAAQDFQDAFWVSAKQNGIVQVWAPLYTMFSRGNIKEKARILNLPSVTTPPAESVSGQCAVDMYAGIGYFAFSYVKAGVEKVLCFEINPWSVNGLKRGAIANGWKFITVEEEEVASSGIGWKKGHIAEPEARLLVFQANNRWARKVVDTFRDELPTIRHVNLGLLPSSEGSWRDAVYLLDEKEGGWLHLHQNLRDDKHFETSTEDIRKQIEIYAKNRWSGKTTQNHGHDIATSMSVSAQLQHVEKVKSYAPGKFALTHSLFLFSHSTLGVVHCVLDIYMKPNLSEHTP